MKAYCCRPVPRAIIKYYWQNGRILEFLRPTDTRMLLFLLLLIVFPNKSHVAEHLHDYIIIHICLMLNK